MSELQWWGERSGPPLPPDMPDIIATVNRLVEDDHKVDRVFLTFQPRVLVFWPMLLHDHAGGGCGTQAS